MIGDGDTGFGSAQNVKRLSPRWLLSLGEAGNQQTTPLVNNGVLIVTSPLGQEINRVYAVDAATGRVLWNHTDLAGLPEQGLEELAGSPLVLISDRAEVPRTVVLNVFNGQLVFDSRVAKVGQISAPRVLPRAGTDCFQSTAQVVVEIYGVGLATLQLNGPTMVSRGDPQPSRRDQGRAAHACQAASPVGRGRGSHGPHRPNPWR